MNKRAERVFCACIMLFSVFIRFMLWHQAPKPQGTGLPEIRVIRSEAEQTQPSAPSIQTLLTPVPDKPTTAEPLSFSDAEAAVITVGGRCSYGFDKTALLTRPSAMDFSQAGPKVLIVHTHSSEAYTPEPGWEYEASDPLRTEDARFSVIRIGTRIAEILEENGIETVHDTALNDYPSYSGAYDRMAATIAGYLAKYPSIQMVLDVHRDAASDAAGNPVSLTQEINGETCAKLMLVVGTNEGGLTHPNWQENLANALKVQALTEREAPGLMRDVDLRTERFNQNLTPGSMLVEFGSTGNTLQQALRSAEYLGRALAALIKGCAAQA